MAIDKLSKTTNDLICKDPFPRSVLDFIRNSSPGNAEDEALAYREFCERYAQEKNAKLKIVMQQILNWTLSTDGSVTSFRYALGEMLNAALKAERKAQKRKYPDELYRVVGDPIGWALHWKQLNVQPSTPSNRLPSQPRSNRRRYSKWTADEIAGAYIEIATHRLSLGRAVDGIVKSLEDRYGLDFRQLEKDFQRREKMKKS